MENTTNFMLEKVHHWWFSRSFICLNSFFAPFHIPSCFFSVLSFQDVCRRTCNVVTLKEKKPTKDGKKVNQNYDEINPIWNGYIYLLKWAIKIEICLNFKCFENVLGLLSIQYGSKFKYFCLKYSNDIKVMTDENKENCSSSFFPIISSSCHSVSPTVYMCLLLLLLLKRFSNIQVSICTTKK